MHEHNVFLTLTYNNDHLPPNQTLVKDHFQKFIRSLRRRTNEKIRFYMCGEYGDKTERPHYHSILFGYRFNDAYLWSTRRGNHVYRSKFLESIWTHGNSEIGTVTFQSAAYVARYILKKQNGSKAIDHYGELDTTTGEIVPTRLPEYTNMSLKPGIGKSWFDKYKTDVFPADRIVLPDGREMTAPKYYRDLLEREDPELAASMRKIRVEKAQASPDNTQPRLQAREKCLQAKTSKLIREHE